MSLVEARKEYDKCALSAQQKVQKHKGAKNSVQDAKKSIESLLSALHEKQLQEISSDLLRHLALPAVSTAASVNDAAMPQALGSVDKSGAVSPSLDELLQDTKEKDAAANSAVPAATLA